MTNSTSFDLYLEPWLIARAPCVASYSSQLAEFHDWVGTKVDAQANYTDRYAPPALHLNRSQQELDISAAGRPQFRPTVPSRCKGRPGY